jgi:hypothetical protein
MLPRSGTLGEFESREGDFKFSDFKGDGRGGGRLNAEREKKRG